MTDRRSFLKQSALATAATLTATSYSRAAGANERLRVGVIGVGGQGRAHVQSWLSHDDVELGYVCDADEQRLAEAARLAPDARAVGDLRTILDDSSIDAVSIATPDHWHTPAALLALDAGKHVYVEKPCSHNVREGQLLIAAQQRTGRIVQHGTQTRSSTGTQQAIQMLREGVIGEVMVARAWDVQWRGPIGHESPSEPPAEFDYDAWVGPAPMVPFQRNRHHYTWHWWYDFGTGDAGNDGVHELDIARWGLGVETQPSRVSGLGGKYVHDDDQQFPDTMTVVFEYPAAPSSASDQAAAARPLGTKQLIYEMRLWSTNYPDGVDNGCEFIGTKGRMLLSKRGKCEVFGPKNERKNHDVSASLGASVADHQRNFIEAIRGQAEPRADAHTAHLSASLSHLVNLAARLGRSFDFDPVTEQIHDDKEAHDLLGRTYREHWATPSQS
jgi:predicted dehydrogenase